MSTIPSLAPFTSRPVLACMARGPVFVPFAGVHTDPRSKLDFVRAGRCLVGAVHITFRA